MSDDLEIAKRDLEEIKKSFKSFLVRSYADEETANNIFNYLARVIRRTIKRESVKIDFSSGGDAVWYMSIFNYLANWLEAEKKTSDLLNQELGNLIEED